MKFSFWQMHHASPKAHAESIAEWARVALVRKYMQGQKEHGGMLWRKETASKTIEEALDLIIYLKTLTEQHREIVNIAQAALNGDIPSHEALQAIKNIIICGNPEGRLSQGNRKSPTKGPLEDR